MKKKFIFWQLRRWLVPLCIFAGVYLFVLVVSTLSDNFYPIGGYSSSSFLILATVFALLISAVFPIMAMTYKFGLQRCDFYYQLPFKEKELKRTIAILGLICVLSIILVGYLFGGAFYALKYALSPEKMRMTLYNGTTRMVDKVSFDWTILLFGLVLILLTSAATYFISASITYINIGVFESIICLVLFHLAASLIVVGPVLLLIRTQLVETMPALVFSFVAPIVGIVQLNEVFVMTMPLTSIDYTFFVNSGVYILIGGLGFSWLFFEKDRSADLDNTKGAPKVFPLIVMHAAAYLLYLTACGSYGTLILTPISMIVWMMITVAYFFLNVLYKHGFKLLKVQWIPMIPIAIAGLICCFM